MGLLEWLLGQPENPGPPPRPIRDARPPVVSPLPSVSPSPRKSRGKQDGGFQVKTMEQRFEGEAARKALEALRRHSNDPSNVLDDFGTRGGPGR